MFYHSLISDWNHGNAHFLRGIVYELLSRDHRVRVYEPRNAWSVQNLTAECGPAAVRGFKKAYPKLCSARYDPETLDLDKALGDADLVIVHEWNDHSLVAAIGKHRARAGGYRLLFHDTHHRSITNPDSMSAYDLTNYDGVLAFGKVIRDIYISQGWANRAWTWHEAADTRVFKPIESKKTEGDLVWIGNWGDNERSAELQQFLLKPAKELGLKARVYGVRYPEEALSALSKAGIDYGGWLPNYRAPQVFSKFKVTVHVPRRPYARALPGIPTIRVFEALACGIPLVSAPWDDVEGLFTTGRDFLVARNSEGMKRHLRTLIEEPEFARQLSEHGLRTILSRHTCVHRVDEMLDIYATLEVGG